MRDIDSWERFNGIVLFNGLRLDAIAFGGQPTYKPMTVLLSMYLNSKPLKHGCLFTYSMSLKLNPFEHL